VYRTRHANGRSTEQLAHTAGLTDLLPYGRQEEGQDSPEGWPQSPTYNPVGQLRRHCRALRAGYMRKRSI
jgi:predicted dithiol-disulfide oxidoreductase (DUF899 family)